MSSRFYGHCLLVSGLPNDIGREETLVYYRDACEVGGVSIFSTPMGNRVAIIDFATAFDLAKGSIRYLSNNSKLQICKLKSNAAFAGALLARPLQLKVSFASSSTNDFKRTLFTKIEGCGEFKISGESRCKDTVVYTLLVSSDFTLGELTSSGSLFLDGQMVTLEYKDSHISEDELNVLRGMGLIDGRLQNYLQGIGMTVGDSVKVISQESSQNPTEAFTSFMQGLEQEELDKLSDISESDDEESGVPEVKYEFCQKEASTSCLEYFSENLRNSTLFTLPNLPVSKLESTPVGKETSSFNLHQEQSSAFSEERVNKVGAQDEIGEIRIVDSQTPQITVEERIIDLLYKLQDYGVCVDPLFFDGVRNKIDPRTLECDLLKVSLKILKTKLRKVKRRDRRRAERKYDLADSDHDDFDQDQELDDDNTINCYANTPSKATDGQKLKSRFSNSLRFAEKLKSCPSFWIEKIKMFSPQSFMSTPQCLEGLPQKLQEIVSRAPVFKPVDKELEEVFLPFKLKLQRLPLINGNSLQSVRPVEENYRFNINKIRFNILSPLLSKPKGCVGK